jgi:hypothetical protein
VLQLEWMMAGGDLVLACCVVHGQAALPGKTRTGYILAV